MLCVLILYISGGTYSLKSTPNDWFFLRNFSWQFYLLSEFLPEICWEEIAEEIFFDFRRKWPNLAPGPKSAPDSDSFWVRRLFNVCVLVFCAPNATILLVYIPAKIKMSFILPKSASSLSRNVVQAYTQPYSFGGRIKLIIYQIRRELSVTVHEISTRWKKKR